MDITVTTIAAAATTRSKLGNGMTSSSIHPGLLAAINQSIARAFNQVIQNQSVLQNQNVAMSLVQPLPAQAPPQQQFMVPPVPHVAFPMQQPFQQPVQQQQFQQAAGHGRGQQGQYQGRHGGQGGRGRGCGGSQAGHQRCPSFAKQICAQNGQGQMLPYQGYQGGMFAPPNPFGGMGPFVHTAQVPPAPNVPSLIKQYANWNACFLSGFDVKDAHTLVTCPIDWHKPNHQLRYTMENAALYAAYGPNTKGQHKTRFPPM